ncbi:ParA family protein [Oceanobacillus halotolerans]|uniref:ParA family protein n=1 Tax=Oceanobacillus halotolerans TaxID=2663380 RepID=UPI00299F1FF0|nr:AAA family ATPase [Oceanobacillus halotolerans]
MNYKGGVGKTTLSANIAAAIADRGKKVLLIDLDPQANLTLSFVTIEEWKSLDRHERTIKHWYDRYLDYNLDTSLKDLIITPARINEKMTRQGNRGRLDMICSHLELVEIDMELSSKLGGNTDRAIRNNYVQVLSRLRMKLGEIKKAYDVIMIDCPPNFNLLTQNAIVSSDYYIIPAKTDYLSTLGIDTLLKHVDSLTKKYNRTIQAVNYQNITAISPKMLGIVFTMVSYWKGLPISAQREYISQIQRRGLPFFKSYLRENKSLFASAPETGIPVVLSGASAQQHSIKREIQNLVDEVLIAIKS